jgi:hypothetical protein
VIDSFRITEHAVIDLNFARDIEIGHTATIGQMLEEIDVEERLDAMINRYLKRLLFLRGLKSLSPTSQAAQPPRIPPLTEAA